MNKILGDHRVLASVLVILAASVAMPVLFVILARLGYPFGLRIVAMAEDYNWMIILAGGTATGKAQIFWTMNDRNPLSPWWYIAFDRLYTGLPNGPYLTRLFMQPLLGLSAFAMVHAATGGRAVGLALGIGIIAGGGIYGASIDQIHWNFLGALSLSMLCVACFATWINGGRRSAFWYGASLALWYCAFASYSFQAGAILSIAALALLAPPVAASRLRSLFAAALEVAPYLVLLIAFSLAWKTTQNPAMADYYQLEPSLLLKNLPASFLFGLSPHRYLGFVYVAWAKLAGLFPVLCLLFGGLAALLHAAAQSRSTTGLGDALRVLLVSFGLVLPTALIESMSSTWTIGFRWPMVDQAWQPLFWLSLTAGLIAILPLQQAFRRHLLSAAVGMAAMLAVGQSLGYNNIQVTRSMTESALRGALSETVRNIPAGEPINLLVIAESGVELSVPDAMSGRIASVWFPSRDTGLRVLTKGAQPLEPGHEAWWKVRFLDQQVENIRVGGGTATYPTLHVFRFDGRNVTPITHLDQADIAGYPVSWERATPLSLPAAR